VVTRAIVAGLVLVAGTAPVRAERSRTWIDTNLVAGVTPLGGESWAAFGLGLELRRALAGGLQVVAGADALALEPAYDADRPPMPDHRRGAAIHGTLALEYAFAFDTSERIRILIAPGAGIGGTLARNLGPSAARTTEIFAGLRISYDMPSKSELAGRGVRARSGGGHLFARVLQSNHDQGLLLGVGFDWGL
jgi:hypothetical protein